MKEYAVQIKIQNNYFLTRMHEAGFDTVASLCRAAGIGPTSLSPYINLKIAPSLKDGNGWRKDVLRVAEVLKCMPEDLFPPAHIHGTLKKNTATVELSAEEIPALMAALPTLALPPSARSEMEDAGAAVNEALSGLDERRQLILKMRFGWDGKGARTLEQVAEAFGLSRGRVTQLEYDALQRLRRSSRKEPLLDALETFNELGDGAQ